MPWACTRQCFRCAGLCPLCSLFGRLHFLTARLFSARPEIRHPYTRFEGDRLSPIWAPDGHIAAVGVPWASSSWRYQR